MAGTTALESELNTSRA
ncbi:hypothetical protein E2C01_101423 [Portunus trituberculatus]|uniref:Uncharacterized protein n=1 Tax=Portunus trituberculatus TaxID=210409 RepID=A0A5B7KLY3_PORTR|nr:hypothetical protein [Portunus trituberculatus]